MTSILLPRPDDWHLHLRDDEMLSAVAGYSAKRFRHALVMPNLRPPITSSADAAAYRARILDQVDEGSSFVPLMTLFASSELDLEDLRSGSESGVVKAVKFYPPGATTNSDQAKGSLGSLHELMEVLVELDMRLLVHAESTDPDVDVFDREAKFLDRQLAPVCERYPELKVTVEHVSTAAGVDFVNAHPQVVASVTPHHLARERGDLLASGMKPDLFCKPVINSASDRAALVAAATGGDSGFFLGTDSAPHTSTAKYAPTVAAGIFNAAYGLEVVAEVFHRAGAIDNLGAFVSVNGAAVYGYEPSDEQIRLTRVESRDVGESKLVTAIGDVVMFGVEEAAHWIVEPV
ncbi:MAG: dihydroorotase [Actinomycetia bacterium]|nr:dihydroorotase [Actinomycetes bacterium]MCP4959904.1 dihydroorotase [Actinomycetes bacterium]